MIFKNIQIDISHRCNLSCVQCDRNCNIVPPDTDMSLEQINKFVTESINENMQWKRIDILGGEPTLHNKLPEIFKVLERYRKFFPETYFQITTNGIDKSKWNMIPDWVYIRNTKKRADQQPTRHDKYHIAPCDLGYYRESICTIPYKCGMSLTTQGYFICGAGAAIARVFKIDCGVPHLKEFTEQTIKNQAKLICKYCGHGYPETNKRTDHEEMSESWKKAFNEYTHTNT